MSGSRLKSDFIVDPSGDLVRDKDKFTSLVEEIIYER